MGLPLKNFTKNAFIPQEFHAISVPPLKNFTIFTLAPKKFPYLSMGGAYFMK